MVWALRSARRRSRSGRRVNGYLDLDVVGGKRVEVELAEVRLAGLDAGDKVGFGQAG